MKKITTIIAACFCAATLFAQQQKVTLSLQQQVQELKAQQGTLRLLVQGNPAEVGEAAKNCGGRLVHASGKICSVEIKATQFETFIADERITRVEGGKRHNQILNDTMKTVHAVTSVRNGMSPLPQGYNGNGVIMGIIDSGVDFTHPDLQDTAGKTRVLYLWDQRESVGPPSPSPFTYGVEWTKAKIDSGLCTHNDLAYYGHGTGVCGIAAGDGSSTNARDFSGVAPASDYVVVALDFAGQNSPVAVADAAAYIFARAQALGRPCVINASVGDYYGSHDGLDLQTQIIENLLLAQNGRSMVGAVGNAGNLPIHLSYTLTGDTNLTFFIPPNSGPIYIQLWADTNNFQNARMAIGATQHTPAFTDHDRTPFTSIAQNLPSTITDTLWHTNGQRLARVQRHATYQGPAYSMEYYIIPDSVANFYYNLELTGSGLFHVWCFDVYSGTLPNSVAYPRIVDYKEPDTTHTVVSSFQCSDHVITVGNFVTRRFYPNYNNQYTEDNTVTAGAIMWNSSVGPTRDGRIRPDITATGANIMTCGVISSMPNFIANAPQIVAPGGYHVVFGGSSASSPVVAGIAALYLQRYPAADVWDVKNAIVNCSMTDAFTGTNLPDNTWGSGKANAFNALTGCAPTGLSNTSVPSGSFSLFPNPIAIGSADNHLTLIYNPENQQTAKAAIIIRNLLGETVYSQVILPGQNTLTLPRSSLSRGVYLCTLTVNGAQTSTQKLVLHD